MEVMRQSLRFNPQPVTVLVVCGVVVALVATVIVLIQLKSVLVPTVFAAFLAFLAEPILSAIVHAPGNLVSFCRRVLRWRGRRRELEASAQAESPSSEAADSAGCHCSAAVVPSGTAANEQCGGSTKAACYWIGKAARRTWDLVSIILCVALLCGSLAGVGAVLYSALESFDWRSFGQGEKMQDIKDALARAGVNLNNVTASDLFSNYRGEVLDTALVVLNVFECILLTILLFIFCLVAILPGIRQRTTSSRVKALMQRYLVCKTIASLIVALACTLALWVMQVPLVAVFGLMTFVFNFIPNIGAFFAILAPLPLVLLDTQKTILDAVLVVVVPFGIHNSLGCVVESSVMAEGLDLHPLTVVVALTFWGSVWGIAGAVLSVPLTCCLKLFLGEVDHPVARTVYDMFQAPFGRTRKKSRKHSLHRGTSGGDGGSSTSLPTASPQPPSRAHTAGHIPSREQPDGDPELPTGGEAGDSAA